MSKNSPKRNVEQVKAWIEQRLSVSAKYREMKNQRKKPSYLQYNGDNEF